MAANPSPEVKAILKQTHDLTTALSNDSLGLAGILLSKELICREVYSKMLIDSYTPSKKAAILVEAVGNTIEIAPVKFQCFVEILSEQVCAKEVVESLRSTYQSLIQDQTKIVADEKCVDIAETIEGFEDRFRSLRKEIRGQLVASGIDTLTFIDSLTSLPTKLKKEYKEDMKELLSSLKKNETLPELFLQLNPLFSFMDYGLLEFIIKEFGNNILQQDMMTYCSDMQIFMKQTTVKELIDCLPGQTDIPPKFEVLKAKIGEDASNYTLDRINTLRKRFCAEVRLSEVVFCLIGLEDSNSFIISWLVPSVLVPDLIEAAKKIKKRFFSDTKMSSLWFCNPKLVPLGPKLKGKYQQSRGSPSPVEWIPAPTKKICDRI